VSDLWIGTYPAAGLGTPAGLGEGVWRATLGNDGALTAAFALELPAPSFLAAHPTLPIVYAVSEDAPTVVSVVDVSDPDRPRVVAAVTTGGQGGCHALLARDAAALYVSHYGSGDLFVILLGEDGLPAPDASTQVFAHSGSGPRADRQGGPHAHFAGYAPDPAYLLVADLGTDQLRSFAVAEDGSLRADGLAATLPAGSGPRHFAVHGQHLYVVCELDHTLRTLRWDGPSGTAEVIAEQPTTRVAQRTGDTVYDAHIALAENGAAPVLLLSVRGVDVVAVFDLGPEGVASYRVSLDVGYWPRHFAIAGERLVVAAERGHELRSYNLAEVLALAPESEVGGYAQLAYQTARVVSPACVAAAGT